MKFTFKTEKSTGRYRSFYPDSHYIKIKGVTVGMIEDKDWHKVSIKVLKDEERTDNNPNKDWMWVKLAREFESVAAAKTWLTENTDKLFRQFKIKTTE